MVEFQKITIPTPQRVNGISKAKGGGAKVFEENYEAKLEFLEE